jgi:hypothetical protein
MHLLEKYLDFLYAHPQMINSIILWNITMVFVYFILIKYRTKMIEGSAGSNTFWEMPEQWGYIWLYVAAPITCYSAFFNSELPSWVWWFNVGVAGYTIGGRWIFEWVLAIRSGSKVVETTTTTTTTPSVEKIEIKQETKKE